ncbi:zinc finger MYM-type protein 5-like [Aphis craccivora]|uniref:Zinc finger MYM-type protein 5-like n=1 Tax=Aphis craccivora TaxID=307492 RepID=A0A6G0Y4T0_APHCR|nr:zinc finger MYM-type protein 5-like [Aphis craccivora]
MTTKAGVKVPIMWLCYSLVLNKVYCESFWLFVDRKNHKLKLNWINSKNDWQHFTQKLSNMKTVHSM